MIAGDGGRGDAGQSRRAREYRLDEIALLGKVRPPPVLRRRRLWNDPGNNALALPELHRLTGPEPSLETASVPELADVYRGHTPNVTHFVPLCLPIRKCICNGQLAWRPGGPYDGFMAQLDAVATLRRVPFFAVLREEELKSLAAHCGVRHVAKDEFLFAEGEPCEDDELVDRIAALG